MPSSFSRRAARTMGATAVGAAGVAGAVALLATVFARKVVTPVRHKPDDVTITELGSDWVEVLRTVQTEVPGQYGLWLQGGAGHARVGEILESNEDWVRRRLLGVDRGRLVRGSARWNQYYYAGDPQQALGLTFSEVQIPTELGEMPAWHVPAAKDSDRWAVLVHGRTATREECLRAIPLLHSMGWNVLVTSYRNDLVAPSSAAGRYHLGLEEWHDVDRAVTWALQNGGEDILLVGWSMGGAICMQLAHESQHRDAVRAVVLDGPVLDWSNVLTHHARNLYMPEAVAQLSEWLMGHSRAHRVTGTSSAVDLGRMNWVQRAQELRHKILILHSSDDEFVPNTPSVQLHKARPDLVTYEPTDTALHTKEWNVDPEGWESAVQKFVLSL